MLEQDIPDETIEEANAIFHPIRYKLVRTMIEKEDIETIATHIYQSIDSADRVAKQFTEKTSFEIAEKLYYLGYRPPEK